MTPEQWQRAREVLADALELKPEDRTAFLDHACSSDHPLRREVERLLASSDEARSSFLQSSVFRVGLLPGTKLGDYEVQRLLGCGGMGEVYRARDLRLERDVAIKVLPAAFCSDQDRLRRFEQEARAAAALNHPNILAVYQLGSYEGSPYLVSELLDGETLREQLKRGPVTQQRAIDYGVQIARGLAAAHDREIVHRDLKPGNLFVTKDGRIKILDFGLAKLGQRNAAGTARTVHEGTQPGMVLGTVGYMSPEQVRGQSADQRADIFAFGAIVYEMLTRRRAFGKDTSADTMSAILQEDPPRISQISPSVPSSLQRVVHRCLEKNPEQRFQSAHDIAFALEAVSDSSNAVMLPVKERASAKKLVWIAAAVAALIIAAAVIIWWRIPVAVPVTIGTKPRAELVRYDRTTKRFLPFLGGIPAIDPSFSRDGRWVAYTSTSDHTLWRSRADGTDRLQLTFPPMQVAWPVISQNGRQVAFQVIGDGGYVISTNGGQPRRFADKNSQGGSLSPDGNSIAFAGWIAGNQGDARTWELRTLNLTNGALSSLRSSQNVIGPFWVNQRTLVAAAGDVVPAQAPAQAQVEWTKLVSFDLKTGKWTDLVSDPIVNWMPSPDGKYLYYATRGTEPKAMRIRLANHQVETLTSLKNLHRFWDFVEEGTQISVAPDGSPVFTRDIGSGDLRAQRDVAVK